MTNVTMTLPIRQLARRTSGYGRTGTLSGLKATDISAALGFKPKRFSKFGGDGKVTMQWDFTVAGKEFSIWDYKGSATIDRFSTNGDPDVFFQLFGAAHNWD